MAYPTKIATCCHCGTRAALTLDRGRHELACASCGAPLHDLKSLPKEAPRKPAISHQPALRQFGGPARPAAPRKKPKRMKRRKSLLNRLVEEAFDLVEDIFD